MKKVSWIFSFLMIFSISLSGNSENIVLQNVNKVYSSIEAHIIRDIELKKREKLLSQRDKVSAVREYYLCNIDLYSTSCEYTWHKGSDNKSPKKI